MFNPKQIIETPENNGNYGFKSLINLPIFWIRYNYVSADISIAIVPNASSECVEPTATYSK